jgi:hypothetical protein
MSLHAADTLPVAAGQMDLNALNAAVKPSHGQPLGTIDYYLDEYTFRFNRRTSRSRGLLFYRLIEQAVMTAPSSYRRIVNRQHNI